MYKIFKKIMLPFVRFLRSIIHNLYMNLLEDILTKTLQDFVQTAFYEGREATGIIKLPSSQIDQTLLKLSKEILKQLKVFQVPSFNMIRVGNQHGDGGYVMYEDFENVDAAYSFGVGGDIGWDKYIAKLGIPVFMYDHTVDAPPKNHKNFYFQKFGVYGPTNIEDLKNINNLIQDNGHFGKNLIIKIDIEGYEYPVIDSMSNEILEKCTQLVCEFHDFHHLLINPQGNYMIRKCLSKVLHYMNCVHIHGNNNEPEVQYEDILLPKVVEMTFLNKNRIHSFEQITKPFTYLDRKCVNKNPELDISYMYTYHQIF